MKDPAFGEDAVRALATAESFARGRDYVRSGAVCGLERRGNRLTAEVEGSDFAPYAVTVELHDGGVAGTRCSCPYEWGGVCKHIVAVLLTYLVVPDAVAQWPSLNSMLEGLDRQALMALLVKRAEEDPALALWLEAELAAGGPGSDLAAGRRTAVDPEPIKRHAQALLSGRPPPRSGWSDGGGPAVDEDALAALIDKARPFLEIGDGRNALSILEPVTEALVPAWLEQADWDEALHEFFPVLGQMIAEAALMADLAPEERDDLMVRLDVWQGMLDEYGLDDHLQVAIDAIEQGWDEIGLGDVLAGRARSWPLSGNGDWTTAWLTQARLRVLEVRGRTDEFLNLARAAGCHGDHAAMLVRRGRITDAVDYACKRFRSAEEILQLSRVLKESGEIEAAMDLAAWGLKRRGDESHPWAMIGLARWLRHNANQLGRSEPALWAARQAFEHSLSLEDFQAAATLAGPDWIHLRPHLLASLATADHARDRTEIYLGEDMIDEAVRSVDPETMPGSSSDAVLLRLAEAAHASHPDWVIGIAERMAADIMEAGRSGHYDLAAQWLEKAALAYDAAGRFEDWITRIEALIERHRRKYKLRPLLEALRL